MTCVGSVRPQPFCFRFPRRRLRTAAGFSTGCHGDWYLTIGGAGYIAPKYTGDNTYEFTGQPLISLGKAGRGGTLHFAQRQRSRCLCSTDGVVPLRRRRQLHLEAGRRDVRRSQGPFRGAVGGEVGHLRRGLSDRVDTRPRRSSRASRAMTACSATSPSTPSPISRRGSGCPAARAFRSPRAGYFDTYYGVNPKESIASGLSRYTIRAAACKSVGARRRASPGRPPTRSPPACLCRIYPAAGPAADFQPGEGARLRATSSLVGLSATYRFDFRL